MPARMVRANIPLQSEFIQSSLCCYGNTVEDAEPLTAVCLGMVTRWSGGGGGGGGGEGEEGRSTCVYTRK